MLNVLFDCKKFYHGNGYNINFFTDCSGDHFDEEEQSFVRDAQDEILRDDSYTTIVESDQEKQKKTSSAPISSMKMPNIKLKISDEGGEGNTSEPTIEGRCK